MAEKGGALINKMKNRRFRKTEEAIFRVFEKLPVDCTAEEIAKMVGISSSTFYRHHQSVSKILCDYEQLIMEMYAGMVEKINGRNMETGNILYQTLIFVMANKEIIKAVAEKDNYLIIYQMIIFLKPIIMKRPGEDKIFNIYACEICGVIMDWQENDYAVEQFGVVRKNIIYLTKTARRRLEPLAN